MTLPDKYSKNYPQYPVKVVTLDEPIRGIIGHVILKCPRCLRGIGITKAMLAGSESIICKGKLGETGFTCNGHYFFDDVLCLLSFIGTV